MDGLTVDVPLINVTYPLRSVALNSSKLFHVKVMPPVRFMVTLYNSAYVLFALAVADIVNCVPDVTTIGAVKNLYSILHQSLMC
jgi:hypothetical protein